MQSGSLSLLHSVEEELTKVAIHPLDAFMDPEVHVTFNTPEIDNNAFGIISPENSPSSSNVPHVMSEQLYTSTSPMLNPVLKLEKFKDTAEASRGARIHDIVSPRPYTPSPSTYRPIIPGVHVSVQENDPAHFASFRLSHSVGTLSKLASQPDEKLDNPDIHITFKTPERDTCADGRAIPEN